jgi:diamine N-acetyltransferase
MIKLRPATAVDLSGIHHWPPYPPEFAELDYALRPDAWLAEHEKKSNTRIYVAELEAEMVAFTLFSEISETDAEFRIALHADRIGQGLGRAITVNQRAVFASDQHELLPVVLMLG